MDSSFEKSKMYMEIKEVLQNKELVDIDDKCIEIKYIVERYIKQALTPPTAEEVCNALSEYFGFEYYYQDNFFYKSDGNKYIYPLKVSGFTEIQLYDGHLPPHLITLIGRFYENLIKER